MRFSSTAVVLVAALGAIAITSQGCGSNDGSGFGDGYKSGGGANGGGGGGGGGDDGGPSFGDDGGGKPPCVNLQCKQVDCSSQGKAADATTISGKVYDPAGVDSLYNAIVYVPNEALQPFKQGASCDKCGVLESGNPVVTTLTDSTGSFTLKNVPVGNDIPLVIQMGKWRRQFTIPTVNQCADNPVPDKTLTFPKNKGQGDIPQMAIATGGADPFECLLLKIGLDPQEFTVPSASGRIHYFVAIGGAPLPGAPSATSLWSNAATMQAYDIVLLPCEGDEYLQEKPQSSAKAIVDYTSLGGRLFTTHYGYAWLAGNCTGGPCGYTPFPSTGVWDVNHYDMASPTPGTIDQSFPKGKAFADWLQNMGATQAKGTLDISESRDDLDKENNPPAQKWITASDQQGQTKVMHITFNTPLNVPDDQQCGRVVYSDFHVSAAERQPGDFPQSCVPGPMTAQEKALEFMLFDLSSCIQKDNQDPQPPKVQ